MSTVLVHDLRLAGDTPVTMADAFLEVNESTPLQGMVQNILNATGSSISRLMIMCHGYEHEGSLGNQSIPMTLGFGLQLCMEDLTLMNTGLMAPLYNSVENIILYSCGPANTTSSTRNSYGDGQQFCRELACQTNAYVYASDASQTYHNGRHDNFRMLSEAIPIDFGNWEGRVYRFSPDGSVAVVQ